MNNGSEIIKTAVQFVDPETGIRTPAFFVHDVIQFATELKTQVEQDESYGNYYCLILGYYSGADELIDISTAPLLRVNSLVDRVLNSEIAEIQAEIQNEVTTHVE